MHDLLTRGRLISTLVWDPSCPAGSVSPVMPPEVETVMKALMLALIAGTFACASSVAGAQEFRPGQSTAASDSTLTLAERQAAWSAHKNEYRRRLLRDGQASADRWLDAQALASRRTQAPPAATPAPASVATPAADAPRAGKKPKGSKNCKKVRWVNRATPGFGGSGMTMSRVAVCDD